ncbi:ribose transport system ATP-binding protein/rhamnose transport system ATP-binding protein [Aminobacter aminovorans]|uniref:Galactose/methyl galactoside import ATP-binding protein MglA n=1 Tax=Aminobacter aminovorans TaxID=83263 RepID=A0A381IML8_AMIAI|nr:sugar ABC transporter ATP-binding protein [Aminobacter aminovorans]TCS21519.1 ribose transport system ATP-binding protein/rhamnose transport system ATP-binding protein [Aminobacter aminovorans]SUY29211.1 Galactose/methyl galactoside import ATP-binding protein MglA [Aminobacter aminovorans]
MLEVEGVIKRFGGVVALDGVSLRAVAGRVHALLGENGAGKSTLLKCLSGVHRPDGGRMALSGQGFAPKNPTESEQAGLRFVHQELNLVPGFTAYENAFVGRPYPRRGGVIDWATMRSRFKAVRDRHGLDLDIDVPVARLSVAKCQIVEILRALMDEARVLVLDEPTASLSEREAATLHGIIRQLASHGCAVILVSHRLDEVFAIADDYTVLRNGCTVGSGQVCDTDRTGVVALMAGGEFDQERVTAPLLHAPLLHPPLMQLSGFSPSPVRDGLDLTVHAGEIVGLYGVVGSGRSSLLKSIWGANPLARGELTLDGKLLPPTGISKRIREGVAYVPEDRRGRGLIMQHSILDNVLLPRLPLYRAMRRVPVVSWQLARRGVRKLLGDRSVKYGRLGDRISTLSGGNQQKIMIGRWVGPSCRLFLLDEPTRGVDVRSKAEIHALCRRLAGDGTAVLFVTSDIEELVMLAQRILVMAYGRITLDAANRDLSRQDIVHAAFETTKELT